jgi:SAM-dependent methyltransferase
MARIEDGFDLASIRKALMDNTDQIIYWNGEAGRRWAERDDFMARLLAPLADALLDYAGIEGSQRALDIGCGGGSQSVALAQRLGAGASVLGVDISTPLLEVARRKTDSVGSGHARLDFLQADAADYAFAAASFDLLFSRFGVMFFTDPETAFSNLRQALRPDGRLVFCCWQSLADNDWVRIPLQAALPHVPAPVIPDPSEPGPFAFADADRVRRILQSSGFCAIEIHSHRPRINFGESPSVLDSAREITLIGPVSRLVIEQPAKTLEAVYASVAEALEPFYQQGQLSLPGAVWFVSAKAG